MNFSATLATRLAAASARAYTDCTVSAPRTDAQALVLEDDGAVIVAFRGSKEIQDWLQDAKCWQSYTECGRVHAGFNADHHELLLPLLTATREALSRLSAAGVVDAQLYLTGHSLGGALAKLFAVVCHRNGLHVRGVYTFGAPRIGDTVWAKAYNTYLGERTFRVVNEYDLVPHLPLSGLVLRYWHSQNEVMLPQLGGPPVIGRSFWKHLLTDALLVSQAYQLAKNPLALWSEAKHQHVVESYREHLSHLTPALSPLLPESQRGEGEK